MSPIDRGISFRGSLVDSLHRLVDALERAAAAAGINVVRTKVAAFAIGAFIAGLAGSMLAYRQGNVSVAAFSVYPFFSFRLCAKIWAEEPSAHEPKLIFLPLALIDA